MSINVCFCYFEGVEVVWFVLFCNGDDEFLSWYDFCYKSNWSNIFNVLLIVDWFGYCNIFCFFFYQVGQDVWIFVSVVVFFIQ